MLTREGPHIDIIVTLHQIRIEKWQLEMQLWGQSFLTFNWWFIVIVIAASYAIWWKLLDKRRVIELLLFGSFIAVARVLFDTWGTSSGRWAYTTDVFPLGHSMFLNDLTIVPLALMLVYQFSPTWKTFIIWLLVAEASTWFLFSPLLIFFGILKLFSWKLYYSYIFVVAVAIIMRAIMIVGLNIQRDSRIDDNKSSTLLVPEPALKPMENQNESEKDHGST